MANLFSTIVVQIDTGWGKKWNWSNSAIFRRVRHVIRTDQSVSGVRASRRIDNGPLWHRGRSSNSGQSGRFAARFPGRGGGRGRMRPVALITRSHCCGRLFIINRSKAGLWRRQIWRPIKYRRRDGAQTRRGISLSWNFLWPFRIKTLRSSSQCPQMPEVSIHHVEYYGERKEEGRNWLSFDYRTDVDSNCQIIY